MASPLRNRIGRQTEANVSYALDQLESLGVIRGYRQTRRHGKEDRKGIDFVIFTEDRRIPIQVKSSDNWLKPGEIPVVIGKSKGLTERLIAVIKAYR